MAGEYQFGVRPRGAQGEGGCHDRIVALLATG